MPGSRCDLEADVAPDASIAAETRAQRLGHRGAIIWLTGLSGSGKSTLATAAEKRLFAAGIVTAVLDGDVLRTGLSCDLGFAAGDRKENVRRAGEAALMLAKAGVLAIAALISPLRDDRAQVAQRAHECGVTFAEVYVNAPIDECERRDPKSLYKKARAGIIPLFTGIHSCYEAPHAPDLELHTDQEPPCRSIEKLSVFALELVRRRRV